jgi:hypothetical protein
MKLFTKADLINAARHAPRPLTFLVGAPLSEDQGGGVPGVTKFLELIRETIQAKWPEELKRYDDNIAAKKGGDAYQSALEWLQGNFAQDMVNKLVAEAVLRALKSSADPNFEGDGHPENWYIPVGARQLAELICGDPKQFPGPILTTNFDPLLSLAIKEAGGFPRLRVIQSDGGLAHDVRNPEETEIVHLHGFWRNSDTLHTADQLTSPRPRLKASLQQLLRERALLVVAYGGWDDVFASALVDVVTDEGANINVYWCFHSSDASEIERQYKSFLARVQLAIIRGRFLTYGGIDCHSIFGEIRKQSGVTSGPIPARKGAAPSPAASAPTAPEATRSPLAGWDWIEAGYLDSIPPLSQGELIRFFDGAVPTWRHAIHPLIPQRPVVKNITERFISGLSRAGCTLQIVRAAGGEGKSTVVLQTAVNLVRSRAANVLWRSSTRVQLPAEQLLQLDSSRQWLVVADDPENLISSMVQAARLLHEAGRGNVHFLLAARDTDWRLLRGDTPPWDSWLLRYPDVVLRGIGKDEAEVIVEAWRNCGKDGLRELAAITSGAQQVEAFVQAVRDVSKGHSPARLEGSLFGGLLAVRFGQNGLKAHVRSLLDRLQKKPIEGSNLTFFDALLYVAACHAGNVQPGLNASVLADLVGVPREWVQSRVVRPLGEEAAAVSAAGHVLTRHSKVAAAIVVEAEQSLDVDLSEVWSTLVRQTVRTSRDIQIGESFSPIVHAGARLQKELPQELPEQRRKAIAIATSDAAVEHMVEWLGCITNLGKTYRQAGDSSKAVEVFRKNLPSITSKVDYLKGVRPFWNEWSVCEGMRGSEKEHTLADIWLCGLSISDHLNPVPVTEDDLKIACAGLGFAFGRLHEPQPNFPYARGRRASVYLGRLATQDPNALRRFDLAERALDEIGTPHPKNLEQAILWLANAVVQAGREIRDPFLRSLAKPAQVTFTQLQKFLSNKRGRVIK